MTDNTNRKPRKTDRGLQQDARRIQREQNIKYTQALRIAKASRTLDGKLRGRGARVESQEEAN